MSGQFLTYLLLLFFSIFPVKASDTACNFDDLTCPDGYQCEVKEQPVKDGKISGTCSPCKKDGQSYDQSKEHCCNNLYSKVVNNVYYCSKDSDAASDKVDPFSGTVDAGCEIKLNGGLDELKRFLTANSFLYALEFMFSTSTGDDYFGWNSSAKTDIGIKIRDGSNSDGRNSIDSLFKDSINTLRSNRCTRNASSSDNYYSFKASSCIIDNDALGIKHLDLLKAESILRATYYWAMTYVYIPVLRFISEEFINTIEQHDFGRDDLRANGKKQSSWCKMTFYYNNTFALGRVCIKKCFFYYDDDRDAFFALTDPAVPDGTDIKTVSNYNSNTSLSRDNEDPVIFDVWPDWVNQPLGALQDKAISTFKSNIAQYSIWKSVNNNFDAPVASYASKYNISTSTQTFTQFNNFQFQSFNSDVAKLVFKSWGYTKDDYVDAPIWRCQYPVDGKAGTMHQAVKYMDTVIQYFITGANLSIQQASCIQNKINDILKAAKKGIPLPPPGGNNPPPNNGPLGATHKSNLPPLNSMVVNDCTNGNCALPIDGFSFGSFKVNTSSEPVVDNFVKKALPSAEIRAKADANYAASREKISDNYKKFMKEKGNTELGKALIAKKDNFDKELQKAIFKQEKGSNPSKEASLSSLENSMIPSALETKTAMTTPSSSSSSSSFNPNSNAITSSQILSKTSSTSSKNFHSFAPSEKELKLNIDNKIERSGEKDNKTFGDSSETIWKKVSRTYFKVYTRWRK